MNSIAISQNTCPYCKMPIKKIPRSHIKCSHCHNIVYRVNNLLVDNDFFIRNKKNQKASFRSKFLFQLLTTNNIHIPFETEKVYITYLRFIQEQIHILNNLGIRSHLSTLLRENSKYFLDFGELKKYNMCNLIQLGLILNSINLSRLKHFLDTSDYSFSSLYSIIGKYDIGPLIDGFLYSYDDIHYGFYFCDCIFSQYQNIFNNPPLALSEIFASIIKYIMPYCNKKIIKEKIDGLILF